MRRILVVLVSFFAICACGGSSGGSSHGSGETPIDPSAPETFKGTYEYDYMRVTYKTPQSEIITSNMLSFFEGLVAIDADSNDILATTGKYNCTAYELDVIDNDEIGINFTGCSDNQSTFDLYIELDKETDNFIEIPNPRI
jgi:hypothetical protein